MKIAGRKTSAAYELYGFIPKVENGKHSAICKSCNRVLQNTAAVRLQKHRNSCVAGRATSSGDPVRFRNVDKSRVTPKPDTVQQNHSLHLNVKAEHSNMTFEDENLNDNENDDSSYEDTMDASNPSKRLHKTSENDEETNIFTISSKSKEEPCSALYQEEDPIQSPIATQRHPPEPFESYHATFNNNKGSVLDIDDKIQQVNEEDLINIADELDVIHDLMPRSKESKQLQDELSKAETEYYRCKAAYFTKLTENCKIKRTLMLLESRKLQLEIEKLTNYS